MNELLLFIMIAILIYVIDHLSKNSIKSLNKNKRITDISYQKYAKFYGEEAHIDDEFKYKLKKIYNMIIKDKCEDLLKIAKESNCTYDECIIKIKYLKNKKYLEDYYIDNLSKTIKKCEGKDRELLSKYNKFIFKKHSQIDDIVTQMPNARIDNKDIVREEVIRDLKYLIDKSLITGVSINEIDNKLVYYSVEKHKKDGKVVYMDCPHCGSLNEVPIGSKKRCEYCETILEHKLDK